MIKGKRIGFIFIALGIGIPIFLLFCVTGYNSQSGIIQNIYQVHIKVYESDSTNKEATGIIRYIPHYVPYRYALALGVFLIFIGIRQIEISKYKNSE